jgi:hypothetical protein
VSVSVNVNVNASTTSTHTTLQYIKLRYIALHTLVLGLILLFELRVLAILMHLLKLELRVGGQ